MSDGEVKIVAFDLYDTLVAARESSIKNVLSMIRMHNSDWRRGSPTLPLPTEELLRRHYGASSGNPEQGPLEDWLTAVWGKDDAYLARIFSEYFRDKKNSHPYMSKAIDGVKECLDYLVSEDYMIALATGASPESVDKKLAEEAGIDVGYFDKVFTRETRIENGKELTTRKPDPAFFDKLIIWAARYGIFPEQCLYAGDHFHDAMAALGAGMHFVGVLTGVATTEQFLKTEVKKENIIKSVKYLPKRLEEGGL